MLCPKLVLIKHDLLPILQTREIKIGAKMGCIYRTLTIEYRKEVVESPFLIPKHTKE